MSFVTTLKLESGDRAVLDRIVEEIQTTAKQKGAELNGPHTFSPEEYSVPQYGDYNSNGRFGTWEYTVYRRELSLVGHQQLASKILSWDFPDAIRVEAEVEQI
ncbi:uS10/mL48 family ribosomal protein [Salinarchaeum sp. IM2453]|uniref:uS10/mL48 family ribosomal protein n=1 Tax=Salinarchaeum sp. IM2453 TaxID=2862870 RepID=UPI001C8321DC|nr:uS10/mL48 family ribosomal protein [Salinarchaeum sp. IM2453]QZA88981.1 uS10/mL48 family ribosomal protein [Salinarchaeum sp. IM2453]